MDTYFEIFTMIVGPLLRIAMILLAGAIWWHYDLSRMEIRRKYEQGRIYFVDVKVLNVRHTISKGYKSWHRNYYANVEYIDEHSCIHTGRVDISKFDLVNSGDVLHVLYDPDRTKFYPAAAAKKPSTQWTIIKILIAVGLIICVLDWIDII